MRPLVTVGIPFLNPGRHFKDAVRSVFSQTLRDWDLILMDDGSTDGSPEIARSIRSDRVTVHVDGRREGLPARLNQISHLAKGTYLARMDADDLMHPRRLERQLTFMESNSYGPVGTAAWMIDDENVVIGKSRRNSDSGKRLDVLSVIKTGGFIHPTLIALRTWFLDNPYATTYARAEDRELFIRTFDKSNFYDLNENLLFYRYTGRQRARSCLQGYRSERKLLRKYGPRLVGRIRNSRLILRSYAKSAVLRSAVLTGLSDRLMQQKYSPIDPLEKEMAEHDIQAVLNTPVPGWDD
ncbi:MAG: glycosyltransferase family 2 protein [Acidobacteriota bacterium]